MSDTTNRQLPDIGQNVTNGQLYALLSMVKDDVDAIKRKQEDTLTAFVVNDLNKPDLDGHRRHHINLNKAQESMEGYKYESTKTLLTGIVGALVALFVPYVYKLLTGG